MKTQEGTNKSIGDFDLVTFDLDGTLAVSKSPLDAEMADLLCRLLEKKKVAVASGASFTQFQTQFLSNLPCEVANPNLYILCTNGAKLYDFANGPHQVYDRTLSEEQRKAVFAAFDIAFAKSGVELPKIVYGIRIEDREAQVTFSALGSEAPVAEKAVWDPDHKKRDRMIEILRAELPGFNFAIGGMTSIDVTEAGVDKAYGLERLLEHIHCPKERLLYVGDALFPGGNDAVVNRLGISTVQVKDVAETKTLISQWLEDMRK